MSPSSVFTARRTRHLLLGAAILSATVSACFPVAPHAHATTGACTSEPVATWSNGYVEDMQATIQTSADNVHNVSYDLKAPEGVTLVSWTDTAELGPKDSHTVTNTSSGWSVGVRASTGGTQASVSASADLLDATQAQVASNSASSSTNVQFWMSLSG